MYGKQLVCLVLLICRSLSAEFEPHYLVKLKVVDMRIEYCAYRSKCT